MVSGKLSSPSPSKGNAHNGCLSGHIAVSLTAAFSVVTTGKPLPVIYSFSSISSPCQHSASFSVIQASGFC